MKPWNSNNTAHAKTHALLVIYDQISKATKFTASNQINMSALTFWVQSASSEMRKQRASSLASSLDLAFRILPPRAKMETGVKMADARLALIAILTDSSKTVGDLGRKVDDLYRWNNE